MDQLTVQCTNPDCARWLRAAPAALGHRIRCPACQQEIRVPGTLDEVRKLEHARYHRLRVTKGPAFLGSEYRLERDRAYTAGRSDDCNLQLPGPTISKRHFSLHWVNNQWVLEDLNTSTGTQVDGLAVTKHALRGGETIEIGAYTLKFLAPGAHHQAGPPAAPQVVLPGKVEPLPLHDAVNEAEHAAREADQALRDARGYTSFTADHLAEVSKPSSSAFSLALATRLVAAAALLVVVTVLSIYGKSWLGLGHKAPVQQAPAQIPPDFVAALDGERFDAAAALLEEVQADPNDPRLPEMQTRLKEGVSRYRGKLYGAARRALDNDDWTLAAEGLRTAQAPVLGPLGRDWQGIAEELNQQQPLARAKDSLAAGRWSDALAELDRASSASASPRARQRVATLRNAVLEDMGGGLLVTVAPHDADAHVTLDAADVSLIGQENWRLPPGVRTLRVTAPGFFESERPVTLKLGDLARVDIKLEPTAPPAAWALLALEHAGELPALWVAAKHYGATGALPPALTDAVAARIEGDVLKKLGTARLRVAHVTLESGEELTARIWSDTGAGLSAQVLPQGSARTFLPTDITRTDDLNAAAAATAVLDGLRNRRDARTSVRDLLAELARLRIGLAGQDELLERVCGDFLAECLRPAEGACAWCAGAGGAPCAECAGKGTVQARVTCPLCKGLQHVDCFECKGAGTMTCQQCGGTGTVTRIVSSGGFINREVTERCSVCKGTGRVACRKCNGDRQVACPKCKGVGTITDKVPCPACKKGRVPCPACGGDGTKAGMDPQKRLEAEREAAQRMSAGGA